MKINITYKDKRHEKAVTERIFPILPEGTKIKTSDKTYPYKHTYITVDDEKMTKKLDE